MRLVYDGTNSVHWHDRWGCIAASVPLLSPNHQAELNAPRKSQGLIPVSRQEGRPRKGDCLSGGGHLQPERLDSMIRPYCFEGDTDCRPGRG